MAGLDRWRGVPVDEWRRRWGLPRLEVHDRIGSTNDVARTLAAQGASAGTLVLAREQTGGRGRRGRSWWAERDRGLLLSMLFRCAPESPLSIRLGLATARAIDAVLPVRTGLKWPNDLHLEGRKVGGILCEGSADPDGAALLVGGLGLNVREPRGDWPPELAGTATSLEAVAGALDPAALAEAVVREWLAVAARPDGPLSVDERSAYADRDVLLDRDVTVDGPVDAGRAAGVASGLDPSGALRLDTGGRVRSVRAGTVRALNPQRRDTP